jgi:mannose-6-phosphate isomerase
MTSTFTAPHELISRHTQPLRRVESLSLQYHRQKDETICLHTGRARIHLGEADGPLRIVTITPGKSFHVPPGTVHRLEAIEDSLFLEVSTPHLDDVVRIEDAYGRES